MHDPIRDRGGGGVVRDDQSSRTRLAHEGAQQAVHDLGVVGVELARRLVREQEPRPVRDGGAGGDALLLAARESTR